MGGHYTPTKARSIHLRYQPSPSNVFYNEVTVQQSTPGSYFVACGFNGGYFGIQELGDGSKIALFSVWDAWKGNDPSAVPAEKRVEVTFQDAAMYGERFGNEGTGAQRFFSFPWQLNQVNRFCVTSTVAADKTDFVGYLYLPDEKAWIHLVTMQAISGGSHLLGTYSFAEDFRRSVNETRRAKFGNGWARNLNGQWVELTMAGFTASPKPEESGEALDRFDAGITENQFYLQTGGPTQQNTPLNSRLDRPTTGQRPLDLPVA
jgi:hypothetical protein